VKPLKPFRIWLNFLKLTPCPINDIKSILDSLRKNDN
jgi:hypothetical protein